MASRSGVTANFGNFSRDIRAMNDRFVHDVGEIVSITVGDIANEARRLAPEDGDPIETEHGPESQQDIKNGRPWVSIRQAIGESEAPDKLSGEIHVEQRAGELAAWREFGTGQSARSYLATVPPQWQAAARRFYISGDGTILNRPYLYPAVINGEKYFKKEIKDLLRRQRP